MSPHESSHSSLAVPDNILNAIAQALEGLRFGQVTIIVQNGQVMQIDRTDRRRMTSPKSEPQAPLKEALGDLQSNVKTG